MKYNSIMRKVDLTVQDLVEICRKQGLPLQSKISVMGNTQIYVHESTDGTIILDEINLACDTCEMECRCIGCKFNTINPPIEASKPSVNPTDGI